MRGKRYLFAAGGTGGHINPALAVAGYIRQREPDAQILFIGTPDRMEARLIPAAGYDFKTIVISGMKRGKNFAALKHNARLVLQMQQSGAKVKEYIRDFQPDVCIGFGGYVSAPVVRTAAKLGVPTAIHESNSFPGVANKTLAKRVDAVMLTTEDAAKHLQPKNPCVITGMPIRGELLAADRALSRFELGIPDDEPLVLSMGGSLGAKPINDAVLAMLLAKHRQKDCIFLHATGGAESCEETLQRLQDAGAEVGEKSAVRIRPYIEDMARVLSAADLVICRAGASSINEFMALGKASILIPSPYLTENHQFHNAMSLVSRGAALLLEEKDLSGESLTKEVDGLLQNPERRQEIGSNAKAMAKLNANEEIYNVVQGVIKPHN